MAKRTFLDFEQPIAELENKIEELRNMQSGNEAAVDITEEIDRLSQKSLKLTQDIYRSLTPWHEILAAPLDLSVDQISLDAKKLSTDLGTSVVSPSPLLPLRYDRISVAHAYI